MCKQPCLVHWVPPPAGCVKLNIDGSCNANSTMSAGGPIRDVMGGWLCGFICKIGVGEPLCLLKLGLSILDFVWLGAMVTQMHW